MQAVEYITFIPKSPTILSETDRIILGQCSQVHFHQALDEVDRVGGLYHRLVDYEEIALIMAESGVVPEETLKRMELIPGCNRKVEALAVIYATMGEPQKSLQVLEKEKVNPVGRIRVLLANARIGIRDGSDAKPFVCQALTETDQLECLYSDTFMVGEYAKIAPLARAVGLDPQSVLEKGKTHLITIESNGTENRWLGNSYARCGLFKEALGVLTLLRGDRDCLRRRNDMLAIVTRQQIDQQFFAEAVETARKWEQSAPNSDFPIINAWIGEALAKQDDPWARDYFYSAWYQSRREMSDIYPTLLPEYQGRALVSLAESMDAVGFQVEGVYIKTSDLLMSAEDDNSSGGALLNGWGKWGITGKLLNSSITRGYIDFAKRELQKLPFKVGPKAKFIALLAAQEYKQSL